MIEADLKKLIAKIQISGAEFQTVEVKRAAQSPPEKLYDTLSSFSNQDDGGIIVFGLYESDNFDAVGIYDAQDLQKKVMEQCNQMEPPVRAVFTVAEISGKTVVSAEIPPVDITERPCFYKAKGRLKGSYIRVGDADIPMTEYEVYSYEAYRKKYQDDVRIVGRAKPPSLDENKLNKYLLQLKENKPNLKGIDDKKILELMSLVLGDQVTLSAVMLFSLYPQAFFPQLSVIAVVVPGNEIGDTDIEGSRFLDNKRIEGTISEMLDGTLQFVRNNMRTKTIIEGNTGIRIDRTDYPMNAVREIILNALVHRDYSIHTEGMPIQLKIFSDRMEVTSPGGLYGRLTLDTLGKVQPDTRNPVLATSLEVMKLTENRYSGIPTIRKEMKEWGLPPPEFRNERGEFTVCLRKTREVGDVGDDRTAALIDFCMTPRTRKELADYLGLSSVTYAIKQYIQPLIDQGIILLSIPDAPSSSRQRYYSRQ